MNKLQSIQDLFSRTMADVTSGAWPDFLKTSAWTFKYSFPDQLLIYAQRPDATACASIDVWNRRLGRTVKENAAHIALIDDRGDEIKLHYVIDVSDTEGTRDIPLWLLTAQNQEYVYTSLAAAFRVSAPAAGQGSTAFFERLARTVVEAQMPQVSLSLQRIHGSCEGLKDLRVEDAESMLRDLLVTSVTAVMMHRCNLAPQFAEPETSLYKNVEMFKDPRAFSILGQTVQAASRDVLLVAAKAAMDYDRTHKEEISYEHHVSESRGVQDPGIGDSREQAPEPIRENAEELSAGESSERVHGDDDHRPSDSPSERTGSAGAGDVRESAEGSGTEEPGAEQSSEHSSMDRAHDDAAQPGGGRGSDDAGVRTGDVNLPDAGEYGIDVSFPSQEEQAAQVASRQLVPHLPQDEIDLVLLSDFTQKVDLGKVRAFFLDNPNSEEAVNFLKEVYADLEDSVIMMDGNYISVEALDTGLFLTSNDSRGIIPWENVSSRIRDLLNDGRYPEPAPAEAIKLPESSADLSVGQKFTIAGVNYLVAGVSDGFIQLQDEDYPIFTTAMERQTLDILLKNEADRLSAASRTPVPDVSEVDNLPLDMEAAAEPEISEEPQPMSEAVSEEQAPVSSEEAGQKEGQPSEPAPEQASEEIGSKEFKEGNDSLTKRNYRFLEHYAPNIMNGNLDYIRFESENFEPLYIERIGHNRIAIAHTYVQNGDLLYDPEMVFAVQEDSKELLPLTYEQSAIGVYQRVYEDPDNLTGKNKRLEQDLNSFFKTWSQNLLWQEHQPIRGTKYRNSGDLEYTFDDSGKMVLKEDLEVQIPIPSEVAFEPSEELLETPEYPVVDVLPFQVGDFYEDETGKGVITQVYPEEFDGRHRPMFSYRDPDAPEGSRAAKGYVISSEAASERIRDGRATLIPASEHASEPAPEKEVTLFDFDFDPQPSEPPAPVPVNAVPDAEGRINYKIPREAENYGGPKARFRNNIEAIRLLKDLEAKNELATPEQQQILARYVGWGGLPQAFDAKESSWSKEYAELRGVLTEEEYESARESTLTAFYTPPAVTEAIYTALSNFGFRRGNILDPCCGTGNFFGMLPAEMQNSKLYGVELDSISGRISRQLYQQANILIEGYEKTKLPDSFYDVAVGNVPFGAYKLADRRYDKENFLIHDYFFAKTLDKVRPGGIVAFITSKGTMDKANESVRRYIAQRADLLGAIRLPNNTFKENAGTEAVADILFLQKRSRPMVQDADWLGLARPWDYNTGTWLSEINEYFVEHPEMVLGDLKEISGPFGKELTCVAREGEDLRTELQLAVANISGTIDLSLDLPEEEEERSTIPADPNVRNFSFTLVDGDIYFREDSQMFKPKLNKKAEQRVKGMIELRDITRELIDAQMRDEPDSVIFALQKQLNVAYDTFSEKNGLINSRANSLAFSDDSSYFLLCSLENVDDQGNFLGKADMFYKRTIGRHVPVTHTETAREALAVCMGERGRVDLGFISTLCGLTEEEALADLKGLIFPVPGKVDAYEISSTYLSGNVRQKLAAAKEAAQHDPKFEVNAQYLEQAIPEPLEPEDISVRLGATWVPQEDVTDFIHELLNFDEYPYLRHYKERIKAVYEPLVDSWNITNKNWDLNRPIVNTAYGTARVPAYRLIEDALNQKNTQVFDTVEGPDGKERRVLNADETIAARDKQEQIKEKFKEWLWADPERSERLAKLYNEKFNSVVPPEYDASMVVFHGMSPLIHLEDHQKEAIARILYGGNTQLAHVVGAGKTWTMVAAAMEGKNLGLCNKSLMVVPNHLVGQWASAIYELYPAANVLASTKKDFETKNRKKFCSRIATGDYDIVVIGHSQFEKIPLSVERQEATLRDQIADITASIESMEGYEKSFSVKQMERTKKSLQAKLEKLQNSKQRDDVVTFEELGVDRLFVDESHEFKNLFLYTKMHNVAGISQTDSQKASDLFMKSRYIDEITGNMGNIHATGTPLSNTMAELYTTQRYLQYDLLQEMGLGSFDAWASTFGETVQSIELAPEGTGYRERTRFANFFNIPELVAIYKQVADVRTADMLNLPVPEVEYHTNVVQASEEQKAEVQLLAERADAIRQRKVTSKDDNMLCVTNDGRKLALDQRLVNPELPDNPDSKANACVKEIMKYYREGEEEKLTQLVFCDLSTPNGNDFNVYQDLKDKLVAEGIPADEIRFIHEANTDEQKEALFAKVRSGAVRVLMGSTGKMGTGTNVQDRLIAGHDLDCPWRPSDLEQRAGRVIRRGNGNDKVHIHRYVTENTFDAYLYQLIEAKQRFASQIFTSKSPVRVAADVDESVLNYSQIKALASGNPKIREKIELEIELARMKTVENNYKRDQRYLEYQIKNIPDDIGKMEYRLRGLQSDLDFINARPSRTEKGELLPCEVQGVEYKKQKEAGEAIFKAMKHLPERGEWFTIGHLRDMRIIARQPLLKDYVELGLAGTRKYAVNHASDPGGLMVRMNNVLDNGISRSVEDCKKALAKLERDLQSAKAEFGKPFPGAQTLKEKRERLQVLEKELSLDNQEKEKYVPEQDEVAPESKQCLSLADKIADAQRRSASQQSASHGREASELSYS